MREREKEVLCSVCGAKNDPANQRCTSCGARLPGADASDPLAAELYGAPEVERFEWRWVGVAFVIYLLLQGTTLGVLPQYMSNYDPQGLPGLLISSGIWFIGAVLVGMISSGKVILEPAVAATLAAVPTIAYLSYITDVYHMSLLAYVVGSVLGVMVTVLGAVLGNRLRG